MIDAMLLDLFFYFFLYSKPPQQSCKEITTTKRHGKIKQKELWSTGEDRFNVLCSKNLETPAINSLTAKKKGQKRDKIADPRTAFITRQPFFHPLTVNFACHESQTKC